MLRAVLIASALLVGCFTESPRPSILFVSIDTLRADRLGVYGSTRPTSPNLDALAKRSVVFDAAFIQEPRTLTSHMSMMTSQYPGVHRVDDESPLADDVVTLAQVLRENGYASQAYTSGGWTAPTWGLDRGFDGYEHDRVEFEPKLLDVQRWLSQNRGRPFFLFLHTFDVHGKGRGPLYVSPPPFGGSFTRFLPAPVVACGLEGACYGRRFNDGLFTEADREHISAAYDEGVAYVDSLMGEVLRLLEKYEIDDHLVILITSDHGEGLIDHGNWSHAELYDEVTRVPLILRLPGDRHAGLRVPWLVESLDLAPTILGLAGIPAPETFQGFDLSAHLGSQSGPRDAVHSVRAKGLQPVLARSVRTERWKLIQFSDRVELYDLEADSGEKRNVAARFPREVESLRGRLRGPVPVAREAPTLSELDPETLEQLRELGYVE